MFRTEEANLTNHKLFDREYFAIPGAQLNNGTRIIEPTFNMDASDCVEKVVTLPSSLWCNMFPRRFFEEEGLLDEDFGTSGWCLDDHLQMLLYTRGWKSVLQTDSLMHHVGFGSSETRTAEEMTKAHYEACQILKKKWRGKVDWSPYAEAIEKPYLQNVRLVGKC